jgi:hypothetical protein
VTVRHLGLQICEALLGSGAVGSLRLPIVTADNGLATGSVWERNANDQGTIVALGD